MNILNQPVGNSIFPSKFSGTQDSSEVNSPTSLSIPGTNPAKLSQSSLLKNNSYGIASGSSRSDFMKIEEQLNYVESHKLLHIQSFAPSIVSSILGIEDIEGEDYKHSSRQRKVLVVSVCSAVELNDKQIELISRKMKKVTGCQRLKLVKTVDPSLIAGFVVDCSSDGSQVIDLSVKGQLANLVAKLETSDNNCIELNFQA